MLRKEKQALEIEEQIAETKRVLNKLRYAIVSNYYKSESSELQRQVQKDTESSSIVPSGIQEFDQKPIHPSLKKLIGKKPVNYNEILTSSRTPRRAAQEASSTISEKFKKTKTIRCETITRPVVTAVPESEVIQLTTSRGRNQLKHTIVVGNTSQFISEQSTSDITHKWMCYLQTRSEVPIEKLVKKVRFNLDSSYAPNDVIDVMSPPFQLTRRGYGEFPIKLLVSFRDEVNLKPIQIYHQLVLDKKFSGHQTLGKETVSELWTRNFLTEDENEERKKALEEVELLNPQNDHDYCKNEAFDKELDELMIESYKVEKEKTFAPLPANQNVLNWIKNHKKLLSMKENFDDKNLVEVNVDENIDEEPQSFRIPGSYELEQKFIEISCKQIGIEKLKFDENAKLLLVRILRKFVVDLLKIAIDESGFGVESTLRVGDVEKALKSREELDFLTGSFS